MGWTELQVGILQRPGAIEEALLERSGFCPELRHQVELPGVHVDCTAAGRLAVQVHHRHLEQVTLRVDEVPVNRGLESPEASECDQTERHATLQERRRKPLACAVQSHALRIHETHETHHAFEQQLEVLQRVARIAGVEEVHFVCIGFVESAEFESLDLLDVANVDGRIDVAVRASHPEPFELTGYGDFGVAESETDVVQIGEVGSAVG